MPTILVPGLRVEFAPVKATGSLGAAFDDLLWEDITPYVLAADGVTFDRGRSDPSATTPTAGQLTVTLDNSDARFTPGRDDGPYGQITTKSALRVTGFTVATGTGAGPFSTEYDPVYYDAVGSDACLLWTGFLTDVDWEMTAGRAVVRFTASDIIASAARTYTQPWLTTRLLTRTSGIVGYWPLTDGSGAGVVSVADMASVPSGLPDGEPLVAFVGPDANLSRGVTSDVSPDADTETVYAFTPAGGSSGFAQLARNVTFDAGGDIAFAAWVRPTTLPAPVAEIRLTQSTTSGTSYTYYLAVEIDASGAITITEDTVTATYGAAGAAPAAAWSHIYVEKDHSETGTFAARWRVWVNGVELSKTSGGASVSAVTRTRCTLRLAVGPTNTSTTMSGQMAHAAVWKTLDSTRAAYLADNGTTRPTAATRMLDLASVTPLPDVLETWMTADADADTAVTAQATNRKTLLELANALAVTCRGDLRVTGTGRLRLASQAATVAPATPTVTLSAETDILMVDGAFGIDDVEAVSTVTVVQQPTGTSYTATRATDPGVESTSIDVWAVDANVAQSLAYMTANRDPDTPKAPTLTLSMEWLTFAGLADAVLNLDLGDLVRVDDLPAAAPASSIDLVVAHIHHSVTTGGWTVTLGTTTPHRGLLLDDPDRGQLNQEVLGV